MLPLTGIKGGSVPDKTELELDPRERRFIKRFADEFRDADIDHIKRLLREDDQARWFWRQARIWGAWLGGVLIGLYTVKDGLVWFWRKLFG